jgi:catechol 2,3-dioxygenase-like lactoylglutathione lyase family enzyme
VNSGDGRLVGLHHVQLAMPVGEEEAARRFYGTVLGLTEVARPQALSPDGGVWFVGGSLEVHLGVEDRFSPADKAHPAFLVDGIERVRARIEDAGYRVSDTVQLEGFHRIYVRDPFGNRVELIEPE